MSNRIGNILCDSNYIIWKDVTMKTGRKKTVEEKRGMTKQDTEHFQVVKVLYLSLQ